MSSRVVAQKCPKCDGTGRIKLGQGLFGKLGPCDNCRGVGYLGKDDLYEYYLERGIDGKYRVKEMKHDRYLAEEGTKQERRNFFRTVFIFFIVISYIVFVFFYLTKNSIDAIFSIVSTLTVIVIFITMTGKLTLWRPLSSLTKYFTSEPKDFKWALKERRKRENE